MSVGGCLDEDDGVDDFELDTDCETAERPDPDGPERDEIVSPIEYPNRPDELTENALKTYVKDYERAYVRNELVDRHGEQLVRFEFSPGRTEIVEAGESYVLEVLYDYSDVIRVEGREAVGDAWNVGAGYAITPNGVRRTVDGSGDPPDPRTDGTWIERFGG